VIHEKRTAALRLSAPLPEPAAWCHKKERFCPARRVCDEASLRELIFLRVFLKIDNVDAVAFAENVLLLFGISQRRVW